MPYALIPDGYTLKKVTKAQKEALDQHNRAQAIRRFTGSQNSSVILLVALAVGLYFIAKQFKLPNLDIKSVFQQAFPQLAAILGIKGELSAKGAQNMQTLLEEGALALDADASVLMQTLFPVGGVKGKIEELQAKKPLGF